MKKGLLVVALALLMALVIPVGCRAPAELQLTSLDVTPPEVIAGEAVNITAEVENTGGSEGTYTAVLTVDGVEMERRDIVVTAGGTGTITFSLVEDTAGSYQIGVGELGSTLVVVEEVELKYDDGAINGGWAIGGYPGRGYVVGFSPPTTPFTIKEIRIYGDLYGAGYENLEFSTEIWDKDLNVLYSKEEPHTKFSHELGWVTVDIPGVAVQNDFYIFVCTHSPREGGIYIAYDSSTVNEHSEVTQDGKMVDWYLETPKEKVNWMIRVVGTHASIPSGAEEEV